MEKENKQKFNEFKDFKELWDKEYPLNVLKPGFGYEKNYKRMKLLEKLCDLNGDSYKNFNLERKNDKCCVIPIWGYGGDHAYPGKIPTCILEELETCGVVTHKYIGTVDHRTQWATKIYKSGHFPIEPKDGDIIVDLDILYDYECYNTMYFYKGRVWWGEHLDTMSFVPSMGLSLSWPNIPLDYWIGGKQYDVPVPIEYIQEFKQNCAFGIPPIEKILLPRKYVEYMERNGLEDSLDRKDEINYSWIERNGKKLYAFFSHPLETKKLSPYEFGICLDLSIHKVLNDEYLPLLKEDSRMVLVEMYHNNQLMPIYNCDFIVLNDEFLEDFFQNQDAP